MWGFIKAVLHVARGLRRIAVALERANQLQELVLREQGIVELQPGVKDEVEVVYGPQKSAREAEEW